MKQRLLLFLTGFILLCSLNLADEKPLSFQYKFKSEILDKLEKETADWKYQMAATEFAFIGDQLNALKFWDEAFPPNSKSYENKKIDSLRNYYKVVNAVDYILESSKEKQILIINEAHHNSRHRKFTCELLESLYKNGYRHLGLEALANDGNGLELNQRGYPKISSFSYINDPQFGNLIRTALSLGYTVFAYEDTNFSDKDHREFNQATNINNFIKSHPKEKTIIHCGFDHVLEGELPSWGRAMAGELKEITGIDPLTINQVYYSAKSQSEFNHPLLKAINPNESSVLIGPNEVVFGYKRNLSFADIAVLHPPSEQKHNRPGWLFSAEKQAIKVNTDSVKIKFPVLAMAYNTGDDERIAVPIDIVEIDHPNDTVFFSLSSGSFKVVFINQSRELQKINLLK